MEQRHRSRRIFDESRSLSNLYRQGIVHASRRCTSLPVSLVNVNDRFYLLVCNEKMSSATWILDTMSLMFGTGGQCSITKLQCANCAKSVLLLIAVLLLSLPTLLFLPNLTTATPSSMACLIFLFIAFN